MKNIEGLDIGFQRRQIRYGFVFSEKQTYFAKQNALTALLDPKGQQKLYIFVEKEHQYKVLPCKITKLDELNLIQTFGRDNVKIS